jgi:flavorubredoxin
VAHTAMGCMVSMNDLADRLPVPLDADATLDLGGKRIRSIHTPHVPHGWDAHVLYEEITGTLFCGDLLSQIGDGPALSTADLVDIAMQTEDLFGSTCLTPDTAPTIRRLAELAPETLAVMHGSSRATGVANELLTLAAAYEERFVAAS